jgi:hypothetical protein
MLPIVGKRFTRRPYVRVYIGVKGHLDESWQAWFAPLLIHYEATGTTVLSGALPDQAALYGVLLKIDRLGLTLISLESTEAAHDVRR